MLPKDRLVQELDVSIVQREAQWQVGGHLAFFLSNWKKRSLDREMVVCFQLELQELPTLKVS